MVKRICVLLFTFLLARSALSAQQYALLVGVSEYPNLSPELSLRGPANDMLVAKHMLLGQQFSENNITLLADGIESDGLPTKAKIMQALASLAGKVKAGDFVYLHFSGHGSQQPSDDFRTETDGLDEIFLPRDVTNWDMQTSQVPNALTDDEVGRALDAIRNKGADVWLIFDSCHSGTMSRSLTNDSVKMRNVNPASLGIPDGVTKPNAPQSTFSSAVVSNQPEPGGNKGALVAFYAAQNTEEAPEMNLPQGDTQAAQGLFSFSISRLVSRFPNATYRQLAQMVLASYNSMPWFRTTPLFEGDSLDRPLFHREGPVQQRFAVRVKGQTFHMQAGSLQGFEIGAQVALYKEITGAEMISQASVEHAQLTQSTLAIPTPLTSGTYYAELSRPAFPAPLRVKWLTPPSDAWIQAQQSLASNALLSRTLNWVGVEDDADISLYPGSKALYLLTLQDQLPCELNMTPTDNCAAADTRFKSHPLGQVSGYAGLLSNMLTRTVRALNLMRLSDSLIGTDGVNSFVERKRPGQAFELMSPERGLVLQDGDELRVEFVNSTVRALDVTILFIDSLFGITQIYPEPGTSGRLQPGEATDFEGTIDASTLGTEQFMIIATPVNRQDPPTNLMHLQQPPLNANVFSRGASGIDFFAQALGDAPQSRGFTKSSATNQATISVIRWQTAKGNN